MALLPTASSTLNGGRSISRERQCRLRAEVVRGTDTLRCDLRHSDQWEHIGHSWSAEGRHHLYAVFLQRHRWRGYWRTKLHAARLWHAYTDAYRDGHSVRNALSDAYVPTGRFPGPWTQAAPVAIDHYGGFMDSDGTFAYEGGGYSFSTSENINQFGKFDPVANTWTPLAPVPDLSNGEASGVYAPNVNKLFVFGGEDIETATVVNTTRIYDIATNTWSTGAPMPDVRAFMGSGYFNGKIYLVGGYTTGNVDPSFGQVWEYDPVLNTWNTSRMSMPATLGGPGFGIINGHIYIAGGRNLANTNLNTLYDYDIAANTWTTRANMPSGVNVPGSAVIAGKLWVFGGGNPFLGSSTSPHIRLQGTKSMVQPAAQPGYHERPAGV